MEKVFSCVAFGNKNGTRKGLHDWRRFCCFGFHGCEVSIVSKFYSGDKGKNPQNFKITKMVAKGSPHAELHGQYWVFIILILGRWTLSFSGLQNEVHLVLSRAALVTRRRRGLSQ